MRGICCSLIVTGAAIALAASTANAAKGSRDAAIERCIAQAQQAAPDEPGTGSGSRRTAIFKSCMTRAGYQP